MRNGWNWALWLLSAAAAAGWTWYVLAWPPDGREEVLELANGISLSTAALALIWIYAELRRRRMQRLLQDWLRESGSAEMTEVRRRLFAAEAGSLAEEDVAARACAFYDGWGQLWKDGALPLRALSGTPGWTAVQLYRVLRPYIRQVRRTRHPQYAVHFEALARALRRRTRRHPREAPRPAVRPDRQDDR